jgi:hypothetical protein
MFVLPVVQNLLPEGFQPDARLGTFALSFLLPSARSSAVLNLLLADVLHLFTSPKGFADIGHVTSAFVAACTDPSSSTSGSAYTIPDNK